MSFQLAWDLVFLVIGLAILAGYPILWWIYRRRR